MSPGRCHFRHNKKSFASCLKACLQIFKQAGILSYTVKKIGGTIKFAGIPGKGQTPMKSFMEAKRVV